MNVCGDCKRDFASVGAFDKHRVGVHAYTYSQGAHMTPSRDDGRRCMDDVEIATAGLMLDKRGRYQDVDSATRVREHFAGAA